MSATQTFVIAVIAVGVLAFVGVLVVAFAARPRRGRVRLDPEAIRRDRRARKRTAVLVGGPAQPEGDATITTAEPVPDPLLDRREVSPEEYGVTRRMFFNRSLSGLWGLFLLQFGLASLAFLWPKLRGGGFGGRIEAGDVDEIKAQLFTATGSVTPVAVPAAQAYIVPLQGEAADTQFQTPGVVAEGVMALWWRCVHLGCRVPVCDPSQGLECPCHGSKYNFHGEYEAGPAPRNLDRFIIEVSESNKLIIDTGTVIQTARAKTKTVMYPQGPSCLTATAE